MNADRDSTSGSPSPRRSRNGQRWSATTVFVAFACAALLQASVGVLCSLWAGDEFGQNPALLTWAVVGGSLVFADLAAVPFGARQPRLVCLVQAWLSGILTVTSAASVLFHAVGPNPVPFWSLVELAIFPMASLSLLVLHVKIVPKHAEDIAIRGNQDVWNAHLRGKLGDDWDLDLWGGE